MERWEALVRFDDEIAEAARVLAPYGHKWIEQLGRAFIALNEDRAYLPNIVQRLTQEAEHERELVVQTLAWKLAEEWVSRFSMTQDGEATSEDALRVLQKAERLGYVLEVERNRTIAATNPTGGTSFLRSNSDILRFGRFLPVGSDER